MKGFNRRRYNVDCTRLTAWVRFLGDIFGRGLPRWGWSPSSLGHIWLLFVVTIASLTACAVQVQGKPLTLPNPFSLFNDFAASDNIIAMSAVLPDDAVGIIIINRRTWNKKVISFNRAFLSGPSLSADGNRLLFVRRYIDDQYNDLVSCDVNTWRCHVMLRIKAPIVSPFYVGMDSILFISGSTGIEKSGRILWMGSDIYIYNARTGIEKVSDLRLAGLRCLSVYGNSFIFSAEENPLKPIFLPKVDPSADPRSNIFEIGFDAETFRVETPTKTLSPLFLVGGYSTTPTAAGDGSMVAFLNTPMDIAPYRFDLVVANRDGKIIQRVKASTRIFSRPVFVGRKVLAFQRLNESYELTTLNVDSGEVVRNRLVGIYESVEQIELIVE
jgi:hypothetical protein